MCTSYSSVQLYKKLPMKLIQYGWDDYRLKDIQTRHDPHTMDWADPESSWQNIFSCIDSRLQHVYMAGGEPYVKKKKKKKKKKTLKMSLTQHDGLCSTCPTGD